MKYNKIERSLPIYSKPMEHGRERLIYEDEKQKYFNYLQTLSDFKVAFEGNFYECESGIEVPENLSKYDLIKSMKRMIEYLSNGREEVIKETTRKIKDEYNKNINKITFELKKLEAEVFLEEYKTKLATSAVSQPSLISKESQNNYHAPSQ